MNKINYALMCDFYELTMTNGYFKFGLKDRICYFDVFFRSVPDDGGFAIACGLEQVIKYIQELHFSSKDIAYLRSKKIFSEEFLEYLSSFQFSGDIWAVLEGTPIFPNEPIMTVKAKAIEAQLIETFVLTTLNHQSLIATKASRIVRAANGRAVFEFGARRAHGPMAATLGARAAYIGGASGTSCALTDFLFQTPAVGTMAHSWIQMFPDELTAFKHYCELYPDGALLLVDTYNVLHSGIPNAIRAFREVLIPMGKRPKGIRLDSGDIAYQSKKARIMLDEAGFSDCKIFASNSLDEYLIRDLIFQDAKVDFFGVGERLITSKSSPIFDGVYKLVAIEEKNTIIPKIKISENLGKITNPHYKKLYRLYDQDNHKAIADLITVYDEEVSCEEYELFDPVAVWKRKIIRNFEKRELLVPIFKQGKLVYKLPKIHEIRKYCLAQLDTLWDEVKRFENPHNYYVDLSQKLWDIKNAMIENSKK